MQDTSIAWTDMSWNPIHGCSRISAGCRNCYAETVSRRFGHTDHPWTAEYAEQNVMERPGKLDEPRNKDGKFVFVDSMSDMFHPAVSGEFIESIFDVMEECPQHVFQILTKRPERAVSLSLDWPENVWMGVSVEHADTKGRIDKLGKIDASTRFVSFEPLIDSVGEVDLSHIDWVIVGGETGEDDVRREMDHDWARDIYQQSRRDDALYFFKQTSGRYPGKGTTLSVYDDENEVYTEQEIQEMPDIPERSKRARAD